MCFSSAVHINTLDESGELMITLFASFAQEESRSISENCKWGIRKRFQNGTIGVVNKHILGYRYDNDLKKYIVIPEEAEIVRRMFALFLEGDSLRTICNKLNAQGCRTVNGKLFQEASLAKMIQNELYACDMCRQKSYMADPMAARKPGNNRYSGVHIFSGMVFCGDCGSRYGSKVLHANDKYRKII